MAENYDGYIRQAVVQYDISVSDKMNVLSGVPVFDIWSIVVFVTFNDMTDVIRHSKVIKFADDTVLQVAGKDVHIISTKLTDDLKNY